ncbi:MAG: FAD-dependent L-sorbose dehydrogenase protein [Devosia sp.]|uniref:GMC family oxidoreductase n=1 Tax=Devosia sp. TaxID=1871048 RepID=UPI00263216A5|nr:GMC family oxidoreductase N-terminal domain-containing protein [Devosia sp.]MDB5585112.1 FAD-dependent L-sorbose dehydrogenase protein [Devosia sp.]
MVETAQHLIIGGGSAGCVLAARLTEDPDVTVILVEAGADLTRASMEPHVRSRYPGKAYLDVNNIWPDLKAYFGPATGKGERHDRRYEQGRLLGGGSAVNAMVANRGAPSDYDEWVGAGAPGWSFEEVLPYFRKLEHDADFNGPYHGKDGPLPVRRISDAKMSPYVTALSDVFETQRFARRDDQNGVWEDGVYVGAIAVTDKGERAPTSIVYLTPEVRARRNLTIISGHLAERLSLEGNRVVGAQIAPTAGGASRTITAQQVTVSAGAIHTPTLLMRSGIGPGAQLQAQGIAVVADRPGVGGNLMEHPSTAVSTYLPPAMRLADLDEHHDHAILRFTSDLPNAPAGDMHAAMIARSGWHSIGQRIGTLFIWLNKPYSRGKLSLTSADPHAEPLVDFAMLSDPRDLPRLRYGFRVGAAGLLGLAQRGATGPVFPTSYSARVAAVGGPGLANMLQRGAFSAMLDAAGPARPWLVRNVITLGLELEKLLTDQAALDDFLRASVGGVWHASGTCRMGRSDDVGAVTNAAGKVYGVEGLRICDASLMPSIPRANTNVPTIMMAERIADLIKQGH